jgi:hypothetical protein
MAADIIAMSKVVDGQIYVPVTLIDNVYAALAYVIREEADAGAFDNDVSNGWVQGVVAVMNVYKLIEATLLEHFAEEIIPDNLEGML